MVVDPKCPRCKQADLETSWHALWGCNQLENLRKDWAVMSEVVIVLENLREDWSVMSKVENFLDGCWARNFVPEFHVGNNNIVRANSQPTVNINSWIPPDPGVFKPNCDVAIDKQMGTVGLSLIICDSKGYGLCLIIQCSKDHCELLASGGEGNCYLPWYHLCVGVWSEPVI
ncbi:hypothetical protein Q3G72_033910 [Acer saccharum]|nr:hypothetical protein Q3G72_033910 [Acer saccharum]